MKKSVAIIVALMFLFIGIVLASDFLTPVTGSFSGGSGVYTNTGERCAISSIVVWGTMQSSNCEIRVETDLTVCTNSATSPILVSETGTVETLWYIDGSGGVMLEHDALIYFATDTTNLLHYTIHRRF